MGRLLGSVLVAAIMSASWPAYAQPSYIVTLVNGNTLSVNSYRMGDGKVYLKYPVGEAAVSVSEVASISAVDGSARLLQVKGVFQPSPEPRETARAGSGGPSSLAPAESRAGPAVAGAPAVNAMRQRFQEQKQHFLENWQKAIQSGSSPGMSSVTGLPSWGSSGPETDAIIDQLSTADDARRAELEKKLDAALAKAFDGDDSVQDQ